MTGRIVRTLLIALTVGASCAGAAAAAPFTSKCGESNFQCTHVKVPLDRSGVLAGTISLYLERFPGGGRHAVIALAGGPGQGNSTVTDSFNRDIPLPKDDYLVVFDQRGTGRSGALDCPELERETKRPLDVRAAACADRLGPKRAYYTTRDSVEDLEAVRKRIGEDKITLYGVSYGTKVAEAYALRYPQHVDRMILDSVVEPEGQNPLDVDTFAAIPRVLGEICRGECQGVTPDLAADVATLAASMRVAPLTGSWTDRRGRVRTVKMTERDLYTLLRSGDLDAAGRAEYPGAIHSAVTGDPLPLLRIEHRYDGIPETPVPVEAVKALSFSLFTATLCEEAPLPWERTAAPDDRLRQTRERAGALPDSAFAPFDREVALDLDSNSLLLQCLRWPAAAEPPALGPGPLPDVPVLVLEGQEDLRTPLEVGTRMAARFAHAQVVAVPKTAHGVLGGRGPKCAATVVRRFFADRALGTPCARARRRGAPVRPVLPAQLGAVKPLHGVAGKRGRTLAAALLTLDDLYREYYTISVLLTHPRAGGLRGGSWSARRGRLELRGYTLVPGVAASGRLRNVDHPAGTLKLSGVSAARGTLKLAAGGTVTGRLGGKRVRARFKPPVPAG